MKRHLLLCCLIGIMSILGYFYFQRKIIFIDHPTIEINSPFYYKKYIKNDKIYIATYSIIIFILASLLSKNNYILFNILKYYNYSNLFFFILIPLIAFTAFSMKSSKKA